MVIAHEVTPKVRKMVMAGLKICQKSPFLPIELLARGIEGVPRLHGIPTLRGKIIYLAQSVASFGTSVDLMSGSSRELTTRDLERLKESPPSSFFEFLYSNAKRNGKKVFSDYRIDFLVEKWTDSDQSRRDMLFIQFMNNFTDDKSTHPEIRNSDFRISDSEIWTNLFAHAFTPLQIVRYLEDLTISSGDHNIQSLYEAMIHGLRIKTAQLFNDKVLPKNDAERAGFLDKIIPFNRLKSDSINQDIADICFLVTPKAYENEIDNAILAFAIQSSDKKIRSRAKREIERRRKSYLPTTEMLFAG